LVGFFDVCETVELGGLGVARPGDCQLELFMPLELAALLGVVLLGFVLEMLLVREVALSFEGLVVEFVHVVPMQVAEQLTQRGDLFRLAFT